MDPHRGERGRGRGWGGVSRGAGRDGGGVEPLGVCAHVGGCGGVVGCWGWEVRGVVLVLWLVWLVGLSARGVLGGGLVPFYVFICFHYIEKVHIVSTCSPVAVSAKTSSHSQGRVNDAKHALL